MASNERKTATTDAFEQRKRTVFGGDWMLEASRRRVVYLAPTRVNLQLAQERHPEITFRATREVSVYVQQHSG